jgi:hypothetical protein
MVELYLTSEEQQRLEEAAKRQNLSPEQLAHRLVVESLEPSDEFIRMVEEDLSENHELYRRLS